MTEDPSTASQTDVASDPAYLREEVARLQEMVDALTRRVEWDQSQVGGEAYGYFRAALALDDRVRQRTRALETTLQQLEQSNDELRSAKNAADEASRSKSEFLATMSHEIRTPMHGMIGAIELLQRTPMNEQQRNLMGALRDASDTLLRLIDDILDVSRLEREQVRLEVADVNLRSLVTDLSGLYAPRTAQRGLSFRCEVDPTTPKIVRMDALRVRQVLSNLLDNAIKFTPSGSVHLLVEASADHELEFRIVDTGIGIAEDQHEAIFEAFRQADTSTTRLYGGTGLGLAICRRLVQLMKGRITVESRNEREKERSGSVFTVVLPAETVVHAVPPTLIRPEEGGSPGPDATRGASDTESASSLAHNTEGPDTDAAEGDAKPHVLVVDDNELNVRMLLEMLRLMDVQADTAPDGEEAVERVVARHYDLVFMDWRMPRMDGLEATREIRKFEAANPQRRRVAIVGLTANVLPGDREKCAEAGMDDFLGKPFRIPDLEAVISKWCATK